MTIISCPEYPTHESLSPKEEFILRACAHYYIHTPPDKALTRTTAEEERDAGKCCVYVEEWRKGVRKGLRGVYVYMRVRVTVTTYVRMSDR